MDAVYEKSKAGLTVKLFHDQDAESPRDWDNLGTMVCFHGRYNLGDKHGMDLEEAQALENSPDVISLPLYLYDHSGITMNTTGFHCPWDSGKVGFIYVTLDKVREEYSVKRISKKTRENVLGVLRGEVEAYDQYLTGDVYGYVVAVDTEDEEFDDADPIESCWGFFGRDYAEKEADDILELCVKNAEEEAKEADAVAAVSYII